ncbi:uncharacterized protein LOC110237451 [Exaiptasia diaphana]|uniref:UPAR/Ly6 domain-containing protein n=1 Tax=Exaiptasia diaphana TaxID=2652724 RepID=A0A913X495_EXADI|nr:uncharacterized protein LOC110237451 [Exaiptasia diaphana]KXJ30071.1 hypothetical protein AC249_AIPGENE13228 [Exaiptasia diaphana]
MKSLHVLFFLLTSLDYSNMVEGDTRCFMCLSADSWSSCDRDAKRVWCYSTSTCIKGSIKGVRNASSIELFFKGCAKTCNKREVPQCADGQLDCQINCCTDGDYCNAGTGLSASIPFTLMLTGTGLTALLRRGIV